MIPNPHPCAPPLPILGAAAGGLLVVAIICAVLVAGAIATLLNRRRLPQVAGAVARWFFWCALIIGIAAGVLSALFVAKC